MLDVGLEVQVVVLTQVSCYGGNDGVAAVNVTNGNPPYVSLNKQYHSVSLFLWFIILQLESKYYQFIFKQLISFVLFL